MALQPTKHKQTNKKPTFLLEKKNFRFEKKETGPVRP